MITRSTTRTYFLGDKDPRVILAADNGRERFLVERIGEILNEGPGIAVYSVNLSGPILTKSNRPHAVRTGNARWVNNLDSAFIPFPTNLRHLLIGSDSLKGELLEGY